MLFRRNESWTIESLESRRLLTAGALDTSYSNDGIASANFGIASRDIAVQIDGRVVIVGSLNGAAAATRLTAIGAVDTTFGTNGLATFPKMKVANAVAIQTDGKIVLAGAPAGSGDGFAVGRLNSNGTPDTSFDGDAYNKPFSDSFYTKYESAQDVAIQFATSTTPERIIVVGTVRDGGPLTEINADFLVARFNLSGSLDNSFDNDGRNTAGFGESDRATTVELDYTGSASTNPQYGSIVVGGYKEIYGPSDRVFALARFKFNGGLDSSFDGDGKLTTYFGYGSTVRGLTIQSNGRIVAVGYRGPTASTGNDFAVAGYLSNGVLDPSFGPNGTGMLTRDFGGDDQAWDVINGADGQLYIGGRTGAAHVILGYTSNGLVDTTFGTGGRATQGYSGGNGVATMARYSGHRFVVGGTSSQVARYLEAGSNIVNVGTFDTLATETPGNSASFLVTRTDRLPYASRVYFSVGGTAVYPGGVLAASRDYSMVNMSTPHILIGTPYVDIPANETFTVATLNVNDDTRVEGDETAIFKIIPNAAYDIGFNESTTITIKDNDGSFVNASADAFVRDGGSAGSNFGTNTELQVKNVTGALRETYLKFNLSSISTITSASLRLYGQLNNPNQANVAVSVFGATDTTWSETGINYTNRPTTSGGALATTTILDSVNRFYDWNITSYLQAQKAAGKTFVTLVLRATAASDPYVRFNSREAGNGPQLVVS